MAREIDFNNLGELINNYTTERSEITINIRVATSSIKT